MEQSGKPVMESVGIGYGLIHGLRHIQPLNPFALYMDPRQSRYIRHCSVCAGASPLYRVALILEKCGEFFFTLRPLAL